LTKELPKTGEKFGKDLDKVVAQVYKELKRIEGLIPTINFEPLIKRISEIEGKIPKIPDEITADSIRNKLENLADEERLDVSAVKEAPRMTVSFKAPDNPRVGDLWGNPLS
jgi:hypothetical protein